MIISTAIQDNSYDMITYYLAFFASVFKGQYVNLLSKFTIQNYKFNIKIYYCNSYFMTFILC